MVIFWRKKIGLCVRQKNNHAKVLPKYVLLFLCQKKLLCQTNNKSKYVEIYQLEHPAQSVNCHPHCHRRLAGNCELLIKMNTFLRTLLLIGGALVLIG